MLFLRMSILPPADTLKFENPLSGGAGRITGFQSSSFNLWSWMHMSHLLLTHSHEPYLRSSPKLVGTTVGQWKWHSWSNFRFFSFYFSHCLRAVCGENPEELRTWKISCTNANGKWHDQKCCVFQVRIFFRMADFSSLWCTRRTLYWNGSSRGSTVYTILAADSTSSYTWLSVTIWITRMISNDW